MAHRAGRIARARSHGHPDGLAAHDTGAASVAIVPHDVDALLAPPTETAALALEAVRAFSSEELVNHCLRSWVWASTLGASRGIAFDAELLYVATMLHDTGVTSHFDAHETPFEVAGGAVAWVFAAGAGWPAERRERAAQIVERHMWPDVDPAEDPEGHLLEVATSLDVSGVGPEQWDRDVLLAVTRRVPRLGFTADFHAAIHAQAERKPGSNAARLDGTGRVLAGGEVWNALLA